MSEFPWLSHYPEALEWNAEIETVPLYQLFDQAVDRYKDRVAVDFLGRAWGYDELGRKTDALAASLQEWGLKPGDRVGIMMPNNPYYLICYFAILKAGGVVVNFNPLYAAAEVEYQSRDAGIRMMMTVNLAICYDKIAPLVRNGRIEAVAVADFPAMIGGVKEYLFRWVKAKELSSVPSDDAHLRLEEMVDGPGNYQPVAIDAEHDIAVLQYTGGTTGVPKGAILTHANAYANAVQAANWCGTRLEEGRETMLGVLPLFHVFAMTVVMNMGLRLGATLILHPRFDLNLVLKDIANKRPTILPGVPTMYAAIANHRKVKQYDLSSLKVCVSGGAGLPQEVKDRFEGITGCILIEGYGLTEAAPVCACNPLKEGAKTGTIGLPFQQTVISIRDMDDPTREVPLGEKGEVCVQGPQVMPGYWNRPDESSQVFVCDEEPPMLRTGDVGIMEESGYVRIVDRLKELIISGGYNIYPRHVEEAIYEHPDVVECAVVGLPCSMKGQIVKAYVVRKEDSTLDGEALKIFLSDRLSKYAIPKQIDFRESLPKSIIGKILKKELLEEEEVKKPE